MSINIIIINLKSASGKSSQSLNSSEDEVCRVYELMKRLLSQLHTTLLPLEVLKPKVIIVLESK